jgi:hypothetical protein
VSLGEVGLVPGWCVSECGVGVGVGGVALSGGECGEFVAGVFEGVEDLPLGGSEVGEEVAGRGASLVGDERGVDDVGEGDDTPTGDYGRGASGVTVDERGNDVGEQQGSVNEQGRRVRRYVGQPARAG